METKSKRCGAFTTTQQPILSDDPHRLTQRKPVGQQSPRQRSRTAVTADGAAG
ncbi:hypothetical protein [Natrinema hispanicum]|uniref:hypothetical protein n=1 Tax=Natrinema hispanicum TaxID=392421 RepID=UPI001C31CFD3|nr:hypothetical protein [Natrinema hispanicum]